jgi:hypothetical protein
MNDIERAYKAGMIQGFRIVQCYVPAVHHLVNQRIDEEYSSWAKYNNKDHCSKSNTGSHEFIMSADTFERPCYKDA